ncbi:MAG TPA: hypothetical protein VMO17_14590 [Terriglobia bacterium]|nr:hypothetical protein [Terriglobia bacterium]
MATEPYREQRRSSRIQFRRGIRISGVDAQGKEFSEETETICISKFGASLRSGRHFSLGQILTVETLGQSHTGQFQVVWIGERDTREEGEIGIEWVDARRFWGIEFPPEDWGGR